MSLQFRLPAAPLRDLVSTYYAVSLAEGAEIEDLLHPEWPNLRFILSGHWSASLGDQRVDPVPESVVVGTTSRACLIRGTGPSETIGVGLLPLGWAQVIGRAADGFADRIVPLPELLGDGVAGLAAELRRADGFDARVACLDAFFLSRLKARPDVASATARAHRLLVAADTRTVAAFARDMGMTVRQLERVCRKAFGFPPKLLLRRQRFLRTLANIQARPGETWAALIDPGYVDQPHFVKDFRRFMGMSPSAYFARPRRLLAPAAVARTELLGAPLQGLHAAPGS